MASLSSVTPKIIFKLLAEKKFSVLTPVILRDPEDLFGIVEEEDEEDEEEEDEDDEGR
jgi:hypothetical protein